MIEKMLEINMEKLTKIAQLKDNWDGNHGVAFDKITLDNTKILVEALKSFEPNIFPCSTGEIQIDIIEKDMYIQLNIYQNQVELFYEFEDGFESDLIRYNKVDAGTIYGKIEEIKKSPHRAGK